MQLVSVFAVVLGCYVVLCLTIPKMRLRNWLNHPASLFMLGACFCILLGLLGFWGVAFLIQHSVRRKSRATFHDMSRQLANIVAGKVGRVTPCAPFCYRLDPAELLLRRGVHRSARPTRS